MFEKLLRRALSSVDRIRVGFVSEPTAIAAADPRRRTIRALTLKEWKVSDARNGDDAAIAAIDTYKDNSVYAVIVSAASSDIVVVALGAAEDKHARPEFLAAFFAEQATRSVLGNSIAAARINPPPPPPPPGHPPWELVGRLDAMLRVGQLPVVNMTELSVDVRLVERVG